MDRCFAIHVQDLTIDGDEQLDFEIPHIKRTGKTSTGLCSTRR